MRKTGSAKPTATRHGKPVIRHGRSKSARRDVYPIVMGALALLVLCVGLSTISMWQDAAQGTATITGSVNNRYYQTLSCARGCARAYYITVGNATSTRDYDVGQTVYGEVQKGDRVTIAYAQNNGDVYRVDVQRNGAWTNLADSPPPTPWTALLTTLGAIAAAAALGVIHVFHTRAQVGNAGGVAGG